MTTPAPDLRAQLAAAQAEVERLRRMAGKPNAADSLAVSYLAAREKVERLRRMLEAQR
jgi:N-methylhydantoinase B/oxoprolinase/acetone carboxylase alpha subunit